MPSARLLGTVTLIAFFGCLAGLAAIPVEFGAVESGAQSASTNEEAERGLISSFSTHDGAKATGVESSDARDPAAGAETMLSESAPPLSAASLQLQLHDINPVIMSPTAMRQTDAGRIPQMPEFACPQFRMASAKSADGKSAHEHIAKYTRYVAQYCNSSGFLQMNVPLPTFLFILDKIAAFVRVKANDHLLDWGSGCGTMLNYFHRRFNTSGVGIDITRDAVAHARAHHQPHQLFCHMDGANLRVFPTESFDAIVSWATLYHVRRTLVQCDIVHQMVRVLKPGGRAFLGHLRTEKTQEYWKKGRCRPPGATIVRTRDHRTFHQPSWKRHQFFSLIVTKLTSDAPLAEGRGQVNESL